MNMYIYIYMCVYIHRHMSIDVKPKPQTLKPNTFQEGLSDLIFAYHDLGRGYRPKNTNMIF